MMNIAARSLAMAALVALSGASLLTACGSSTSPALPPPLPVICVGPETPDDLEDLVDRDIVRHPDEACRAGNPLFGFEQVAFAPEIGDELDSTSVLAYRSKYRAPLASRSLNRTPGVQTPTRAPAPSASRTPPTSVSRAPAPTSAPTRAPSATRAPAPAPSVAPAPAPRRTTCTGTGSKRRCTTR